MTKRSRATMLFSDAGRPDYLLVGLLLALVLFGILMLSSASVAPGFQRFDDSYYYVKHQVLLGLIPGAVLFLLASRLNYRLWERLAFPLLIITIVLLISVFVPMLGFSYGGARRWISVGTLIFQPSEIAKLTFVLYLGAWLSKRRHEISDFSYGFVPFSVLTGLVALLLVLQPDIGTMFVIIGIAVAVYFVAGAKAKHVVAFLAGLAAVGFLVIQLAPYRVARLAVYFNRGSDPEGIGYHINQAILAIGSGGLFGVGFGGARQKDFIPEVSGDSIFAIIGEEFGFVVASGVILLFLALAWRGFRIARGTNDQFGKLVATGFTSWIVLQALVNIGAMVGVLPLTGIPLPFISYGGSAMATSLAAMGILTNISRSAKLRVKR